ncbi:DegT/DnrJ/EryC1/StrS family aminotransferase [Staphylococcus simulans]
METLICGCITPVLKTKAFDEALTAYMGTEVTVAMNSATAALEITLRLLGIGARGEVIPSAYTYTASASVIAPVGAKILLVDPQKNPLERDFPTLEDKTTEKTNAIIPQELAGQFGDYDQFF